MTGAYRRSEAWARWLFIGWFCVGVALGLLLAGHYALSTGAAIIALLNLFMAYRSLGLSGNAPSENGDLRPCGVEGCAVLVPLSHPYCATHANAPSSGVS